MTPDYVVPYLRERMRLADAILFTGAGFARGMRNILGNPMPLGAELKPLLWSISFPSDPYEEGSSLQDLFDYARTRRQGALKDLLQKHLTIDADSIPTYYAMMMSLPWHRVYTLNVDNFPQAISRAYALPRKLVTASAVSRTGRGSSGDSDRSLDYVYLNGNLEDGPEGVTFSTTQYAERLTGQDPLYAQFAADVLARPAVFIGTVLDESPLWQHMSMRRRGNATGAEFRRKSFLVSPSLDRARRELLEREFNIIHLSMTAETFSAKVLGELTSSAAEGFQLLKAAQNTSRTTSIPLISSFITETTPHPTEFLIGQSPTWADLQHGRAAYRHVDESIEEQVNKVVSQDNEDIRGVILLTGTAGSGKSTVCMRLGLKLTAIGFNVGWVDSDVDIAPIDIRKSMEQPNAPTVLIVDDADQYGTSTADLIAEITRLPRYPLVILSIRSGRADRIADRLSMLNVPVQEVIMPHLTDSDIDRLIEVLDRENRLGVLKGKSRREQLASFREYANRQLIVAMLAATSGRKFEERIRDEMEGLEHESRNVYGLVAIATAIRFGLTRDEVLLAVRDASNATLIAIENLERRHLVLRNPRGELRVRHRVIAEVLLESMAKDGSLEAALTHLAVAAATKVGPGVKRSSPPYRRVRTLMNHDWLTRYVGQAAAQRIYADLEPLMHWDYHFWLQRGSLELESGDIQLAENFLNQAYSLEEYDPIVQTEYGYLQLKLSVEVTNGEESRRLFHEGTSLLAAAIRARGGSDPHQYHIYGKQGLRWIQRSDIGERDRESILQELTKVVEDGRKAHPRDERLRELFVEVQNFRLGKRHKKRDKRIPFSPRSGQRRGGHNAKQMPTSETKLSDKKDSGTSKPRKRNRRRRRGTGGGTNDGSTGSSK